MLLVRRWSGRSDNPQQSCGLEQAVSGRLLGCVLQAQCVRREWVGGGERGKGGRGRVCVCGRGKEGGGKGEGRGGGVVRVRD